MCVLQKAPRSLRFDKAMKKMKLKEYMIMLGKCTDTDQILCLEPDVNF